MSFTARGLVALFVVLALAFTAMADNAENPERMVILLDATGASVGDAEVTVRFADPARQPQVMVASGGILTLDAKLKLGDAADVVTPQHGDVRVDLRDQANGRRFVLPVVKPGTPAYERTLRGVVVGPDGKPLAGAVVRCEHVRTPGDGLFNSVSEVAVLTGANGRFAIYPADREVGRFGVFDGPVFELNQVKQHGEIVPLNSTYSIMALGPDGTDFFPSHGQYNNTDFARIELKEPAVARTLMYESPKDAGGCLDEKTRGQVRLYYERDARSERFELPARYRAGGKLAMGRYTAELGRVTYQPLQVSDDGPAELVFRLPPPVTFDGRVVDGVSGDPLAGVFVIAMHSGGGGRLADITPDEWRLLEQLPVNPRTDDPALEPVHKAYGLDAVARTDAAGRFELRQNPAGGQPYGLLFFAQDRLPLLHQLYDTKPDADTHRATLRDVALYQAATVTLRLQWQKEPGLNQPSVHPYWEFADAEKQPAWFREFKRTVDGGAPRRWEVGGWLNGAKPRTLLVPAGLTLRVTLDAGGDEQWSCREPADMFRLDAGRSKDLGDVTFVKNLLVTVKVTDPAGRGVEGAPVRQLNRRNVWTVVHNTDEKGEAQFYVAPNSAGTFGIIDIPGFDWRNVPGNLQVPFQVGDDVPADDKPFIFKLTAEQVQKLRGDKPQADTVG